MDGPDTSTHRIGLRFDRSEVGRLRRTADLLRAFDPEAVGLLTKAADAAVVNGLLEITCSDPSEAIKVADDFPQRWGMKRPAVEPMVTA